MEALDQEQDILLDACLRASTPSINSHGASGRRVPPKDRRRPTDRSRFSGMFKKVNIYLFIIYY